MNTKFILLNLLLIASVFSIKAPAFYDRNMHEKEWNECNQDFTNRLNILKIKMREADQRLRQAQEESDLEASDESGNTPFLTACAAGNFEAVKKAVLLNCNIFAINNAGQGGLQLATVARNYAMNFSDTIKYQPDRVLFVQHYLSQEEQQEHGKIVEKTLQIVDYLNDLYKKRKKIFEFFEGGKIDETNGKRQII